MSVIWYLIYIVSIGGYTLTSQKIQMDTSGACIHSLHELHNDRNDESFCISSQGTILK